MKRSNQKAWKVLAFALIVLAILLLAVVVVYRDIGDSPSNSTSGASGSPAPAAANSAGATNQASQSSQGTSASAAKPVEDKIIATQIAGTVKNERSEVLTDAVVVLFTGDRKGSEPQMVESGQFRFKQVPLKPDVTYSLQAKAPGLCGEESFTSKAVDSEQKISKDIILKSCPTQVAGNQGTKVEVPGLTNISEGLTGTIAVLNSMKVWTQALAIIWVLTIAAFLLTTIAFMISVYRQTAENGRRINILWQSEFDHEPKNQPPPVEPARMVLNLPLEFSQTLQNLLVAITKNLPPSGGAAPEPPLTEKTPPPPVTIMTPVYQSKAGNSAPDSGSWYQTLLQGKVVSPPPLYTEIHDETSVFDSNRRMLFDLRANHGSFVILAGRDDTGWIFPNPRSTFVSDHHRVFEELNQRNFEQERTNIAPKRVIYQEGCWQLIYELT